MSNNIFLHSKVEACVNNEWCGPRCIRTKSKILIPKCSDVVNEKKCNKIYFIIKPNQTISLCRWAVLGSLPALMFCCSHLHLAGGLALLSLGWLNQGIYLRPEWAQQNKEGRHVNSWPRRVTAENSDQLKRKCCINHCSSPSAFGPLFSQANDNRDMLKSPEASLA